MASHVQPGLQTRSPGPTATEAQTLTRLSNKMGKELESWCSEKQRKKAAGADHVPCPLSCPLGRCVCYVQHGHTQLCSCGIDCSPMGLTRHHEGPESESEPPIIL
ncbi:hypothetical protein GWK47_003173 [Chionoecetes opilio]|uniref:Uncharacterized protein n=1 Tax=Chionoecetes opilio TaxID=41210 RepID=A0A8J8WA61_CHIOP|nr:hypothetical protein GWK47_003173 [Chionoecetes opilio]